LEQDNPNDPPYKDKIFFVLKMGSGQANMAVSNSTVTIQVLSENNDFIDAHDILDAFVADVNFKYQDAEDVDGNVIGGMVQAYFTPEISMSQESVYTGFRSLMSIRGFVRLPSNGFAFAMAIEVTYGDGVTAKVPFFHYNYNYATQTDPQAFAGSNGSTMALNRQSTEVISFNTYMQIGSEDEALAGFYKAILGARKQMNAKFNVKVLSNVKDEHDEFIPLDDDWFVLCGINYEQELGDIAPWVLSFAKAKRAED